MNNGKKILQDKRLGGKGRPGKGNLVIGWENVERRRKKAEKSKSKDIVGWAGGNRRMGFDEEDSHEIVQKDAALEIERKAQSSHAQTAKIHKKESTNEKSKRISPKGPNEIMTRTKNLGSTAYHEKTPPPLLPFTLGDQVQGVLAILPPRNSTRRAGLPSYSSPTLSSSPPSPPLGPSGGSDSECYMETECTASCGEGFRLLLPNLQDQNCHAAVLQVSPKSTTIDLQHICPGHSLQRNRLSCRLPVAGLVSVD